MKQSNIDFLESNRHHYDLWQRAQITNNLDYGIREKFLFVIREEFDAGYLANLWCPPCIITMMTFVYTQYDKWKASQNVKENNV